MKNNLRDQALMELHKRQSSSQSRYDWYRQAMNAESSQRREQFDGIRQR